MNESAFAFLQLIEAGISFDQILAELSEAGISNIEGRKRVEDFLEIMNFADDSIEHNIIPRKFATPLSVSWNITSECNFRCYHCLNNSGHKNEQELTTNDSISLVDQFSDWGVLSVWIGGGEPLTRPDLFTILERLKSKNIGCILATNGSLITPENVKFLTELTDSIEISLDGTTNQENQYLRGISNGLDIVTRASELIRNSTPDSYFSINSTIHKNNLHQVEKLIDLSWELGANKWAHNELFLAGRAHSLKSWVMDYKDLNQFRAKLVKKEKEYKNKKFKINSYVRLQNFERQALFEEKAWYCSAGSQELMIDECGNIFPCQRLQFPTFKFGKFPEQKLTEVWEKSECRTWFNNLPVERSECFKCKKYHGRVCNGGCRAEKWIHFRNLFSKDPLCKPAF